jgi:hypothetical protein
MTPLSSRLSVLALTSLLALAVAAPGQAVLPDMVGTWHVLVHFKDKGTVNADTERWEDRIWEFKMEGSRLVWIDYPIVVFEDQSGRFEKFDGRNSRSLHYWAPNGNQRRQIREGLAINQRGSRTKTLRGSADKGWSSAKRRGGYRSASIVTFQETWTIEERGGLPAFIRDDVMGSASTESMEGRTLYETEAIEANGDVLRGRFDRDEGMRAGTFRLMRSGEASSVGSSGKTLRDRDAEGVTFNSILAGQLKSLPGEHGENWYRERVEAGTITEADRFALRAAFEERLQEGLSTDADRNSFRVIVQNLALRMERLFVEEGKSLADLRKMLREGKLSF